ncbi:stage II sporulation protein M [Bacillus xiapuensis]|uniref:hypothetical protein n=1 Tax=Bacillus xiapuensis TaxID=2014075 RepID=UPI001E333151|nr:hypothetical protein [Bacillus xiapuensis]
MKRNRDAFLFSLLTILISFFGPMIYLQLTGAGDVNTIEQAVTVMNMENSDEEDLTWQSVFFHNLMILLPVCIGVLSFGFVSFSILFYKV